MNRNIIYALLSILAIFLFSCDSGNNEIGSFIYKFDLDDLKSKRVYLSDDYSNPTLIKLETTDESIFGSFNEIKVYNDCIYILDCTITNSILSFDIHTGKFNFKLRNIGKGKGEYLYPRSFSVSDDTIFIYDYGTKKVLLFDLKGNFISEFKINFWANQIEAFDGKLYFYCDVKGKYDEQKDFKNSFLVVTNYKGEDINCYLNHNDYLFENDKPQRINFGSFYKSENGLYLMISPINSIFLIKNDSLTSLINLTSVKNNNDKFKLQLYDMIVDEKYINFRALGLNYLTFNKYDSTLYKTYWHDDLTELNPRFFYMDKKYLYGIYDFSKGSDKYFKSKFTKDLTFLPNFDDNPYLIIYNRK